MTITQPPGASWPSNKVFVQKLRYLTCYILIGNYARWQRGEGNPPTLAALQRAAVASPRQIAGYIKDLRHGGYIVAEQQERDRRRYHLRPTAALIHEVARSPLAFLAASERLEPSSRPLVETISSSPERMCDWLGRSMDCYQDDDSLFAPFRTIVQVTERECGYPLMAAVLGAHYAAQRGLDTGLPTLTYRVLAERFQVSRQHIGNMLAEAERQGWFSIVPGGHLREISADFIAEFETWAAGQMAHYRLLAELVSSRAGTEPETMAV
ncbi:MarR family transcriptional regulator [Microvirga sp. 3-52]|uniref:MarR family transcriptional regulator n=1 Tax=Microvirga sp. 3-52 TaxID=2792425 RepID=UPI0028967370|nr:MarR family transcriptional regulator [Microvirga sp. 3-52]